MKQEDDKIAELHEEVKVFGVVALAVFLLLTCSTLFYHFQEGWSLLDSLYFTVITVSTVGYGNLVPHTALGKIVNMLIIVVGIGLFTVFITQLMKRQHLRRLLKKNKR